MRRDIREPTVHDAAALAEFHVGAWRETYAHLLPDGFFSTEYIAGRHAMWTGVLTDVPEGMTIRLAEADDGIVGFAWAGPVSRSEEEPPRATQLYAIYLAASHHGSGMAQALLDDVLGAAPAMLWVAKQNPRAIAFYARNRFEFDGAEQTDPQAPQITGARMVR